MSDALFQPAAVAIGSNLGDRQAHVAFAFESLAALPDTRLLARGPIIETAPLAAPGLDAGGPYLNSAAVVSTRLSPRELLARLHAIERSRGRTREVGGGGGGEPRWAPRTLDLDLITYADRTINEPGLTLPHPRAHERAFVLEPLAAIAPTLVIPGRGRVADLLARVTGKSYCKHGTRSFPVLILLLVLIVISAAFALPALADPPPVPPPTPTEVLLDLQGSYRTAPTCERIQVEVRYPAPSPATGSRSSRSSISVQLQPPTEFAKPETAAIALELGPLRVFAGGGQLTAIHSRDPATFFQSTIDQSLTPAALGAAIPPILLPELDLLAAPALSPVASFWPYATGISWQSVEVDPKHPSKRTVHGVCTGGGWGGGGAVTLIEQAHRLRSLTIDLPAKRTTLTLTFSSFGPCEPMKAAIDIAKRQRVDAMEELRPRSGTLRVGVRIPSMPITQGMGGPDKNGWDMGSLLQPPLAAAAAGIKPAEHVVLIFLRTKPLAPPAGERRFSPDALAAILKRTHDDAFRVHAPGDAEKDPAAAIARFGFAPVYVMNAPEPDEILNRVREAGTKWPEVLWTTEAKSTIDLFTPGADAVAVILDAEYVLRAVIPIDAAQTAEQVSDQITASLFELGAAESK